MALIFQRELGTLPFQLNFRKLHQKLRGLRNTRTNITSGKVVEKDMFVDIHEATVTTVRGRFSGILGHSWLTDYRGAKEPGVP
jgi:hypothetical protein